MLLPVTSLDPRSKQTDIHWTVVTVRDRFGRFR
jgi:hypothetical protein